MEFVGVISMPSQILIPFPTWAFTPPKIAVLLAPKAANSTYGVYI